MNWLFGVVAVLIGYQVFDGFRKGFIRKAVSAVSLILTLVLVTQLTPHITTFIREKTSLQDSLQQTCSEIFLSEEYNEEVKNDQIYMIENMDLPDNIKELLLENNNHEAYEVLEVTGFHQYVGAYLANLIISAMAYLISFLIVWTALKALIIALDLVAKLPLLKGVNRLTGAVLGLAQGIVLTWVIFLIGTVLCNGAMGQQFMGLIYENPFLTLLYDYNFILKIVLGLIF